MKFIRVQNLHPWKMLPLVVAAMLPLHCFAAPQVQVVANRDGMQIADPASSSTVAAPARVFHSLPAVSKASAAGAGGVAIGSGSSAAAENAVAIGDGASATTDGSVALGARSIANRGNAVSVGSAGNERQVTNVAAGTAATDAANVGQLNAGMSQAQSWADSYTDQRAAAVSGQVQRMGNQADAGVAGAMAMAGLPQAYEPGKTMAAASAGVFRHQSGVAVGVSTISDSGRWVYKATGSTDSRGNDGLTIGAGVQW